MKKNLKEIKMTFNHRKNCNENEDYVKKSHNPEEKRVKFHKNPTNGGKLIHREEILKQIEKCILNDRQNTYGTPEDNFQVIADLWNVYLGIKDEDLQLTKQDVAIMMMLLKVARMKSSPNHLDNYVDAAGYSVIAGSFCNTEKGD